MVTSQASANQHFADDAPAEQPAEKSLNHRQQTCQKSHSNCRDQDDQPLDEMPSRFFRSLREVEFPVPDQQRKNHQ